MRLEVLCPDEFVGAMNARPADEGRSFFSKVKVGDAAFSPLVSLRSDPRNARTPMLPFDGEGRPLEVQPWITAGKLEALAMSRFWAQKTKRAPVGGHGGFELAAGTTPRAKLLEGIKRGVLISRFWYTNWVDGQTLLLTGLTRDGTFWIEKGKIVEPVRNFRWNDSPLSVLAKVVALGKRLACEAQPPTELPVPRQGPSPSDGQIRRNGRPPCSSARRLP